MGMDQVVLSLAVLTPLALGAGFVLARHRRRPSSGLSLSAVSRQHIDLARGVPADQLRSAVEQIAALVVRGNAAAVERRLRRGLSYVVQVRALAEIGGTHAARILEGQLGRRLTDDPVEQGWYWIDLVQALRHLDCAESVPHVLRRTDAAAETPLGDYFAAEAACLSGFVEYLRRPASALGRVAVRTLRRALAGLRRGVSVKFVAEARVGELVETLWDSLDGEPDAAAVRVFVEAIRIPARCTGGSAEAPAEEEESLRWQLSRLQSLEPALRRYLGAVAGMLGARLQAAPETEQVEILAALDELKADVAGWVIPALDDSRLAPAAAGAHLLRWSRDVRAAAWLREHAKDASHEIAAACLLALAGHPGADSERVLLTTSVHRSPAIRRAAAGGLGWWEPSSPAMVGAALGRLRLDREAEVRRAARAALARLGERQALQNFRMALASADVRRVADAIDTVASEGLILLWPDLDRLADSGDEDIAERACVALEDLREQVIGPSGV